ncbi:MAG: hypothetical protein Q7S45_01875 [Candidatus Curtissbacteria bacterium]|nr:hypothetical protein [Candidatus Curtissbacteria bacterium]
MAKKQAIKKLPDNQIAFYQSPDGSVNIEVLFAEENIWLTQKKMAELFDCSTDNISLHLKNIFGEKELDKDSVTEEYSTTMTSGLMRGSNIVASVPKYLVMPEEREEQFNRKIKSPLFAERFKDDNWQILYFDSIRNNWKKLKQKNIKLGSLVGKKGPEALRPNSNENDNGQIGLL